MIHSWAKRSNWDGAHHKPGLEQLLRAIHLHVTYHRGSGNSLYFRDPTGEEIEVLDWVGGYGSLLLGHAHPNLVAAAGDYWQRHGANYVQGSLRPRASELARELSRRSGGNYCAVFSNSGAEAVETAVKHALLETGGQTFLALEHGFHGKTLAALQLTANPRYRDAFPCQTLKVHRVRPNDLTSLAHSLAIVERPAGFIYEPIQGEAGVRPLEAGFLQRAAELCRERQIPMIADECQTGLGRTGCFLASQHADMRPDYVILSKSLGGGVAKIAATLIDRDRYRPEFDLLHSSTFADDEYSSSMALTTLRHIDDLLMNRCRTIGQWLRERLQGVVEEHPQSFCAVRGQGLLLGLELSDQSHSESFVLRYLSAQGLLGLIVCAYLLHRHRLRVAVTLSDPNTLRLQPSALIETLHCQRLVEAVRELAGLLQRSDVIGLTRYLVEQPVPDSTVPRIPETPIPHIRHSPAGDLPNHSATPRGRVAWLFHLIDESDAVHLDPALHQLPAEKRARYIDRLASIAEPILMDELIVHSKSGASVSVVPILLPVTSRWIRRMFESRQRGPLRDLVQRGVSLAESFGCHTAALGQFTSIVTRNGRALTTNQLRLVTGNSYTTSLIIEAVTARLAELQRSTAAQRIAILGGGGNIGSACAAILAHQCRQLILLGSGKPSTQSRLRAVAEDCNATISTNLADLRRADVVICATNDVDSFVRREFLRTNSIVCDVSVPPAVPWGERSRNQDVHWIAGGIVRLPCGERITIPGFPLPAGLTYGCMGEALLLGLEADRCTSYVGPVQVSHVQRLSRLAARHGFVHSEVKSVETPRPREETVCAD